MTQISSGTFTITDVTDGAPGLNNTTVFLYKRATSAPDKPTSNLTYIFATASVTGALEGWVQSIDGLSGSAPIWMIAAVASSTGESDVIESNEWVGPIKMAQNGQDGRPGTNGLNQATIFIYKRDDSAIAPSSTTYTFSTGDFVIPSGWNKTIPTTPKGKPCWVTSAVAIGAEATAVLNWASPSILVEDGIDGKSPTVTATGNGVKIVDGDGNETYITNGADGSSYYTFIRYSKNANGSGYVATPTSETIYIGVYAGTASSPPAYNDSGWTWSRYVGADGQPGARGVSVTSTRELYYLKTNSTDPTQITNANQIHTTDDVNQWTSVVPTYIGSGKYYTCIETSLSNGTVVWSAPVENKGLTDANVNAMQAVEIAKGVRQHFFWLPEDVSSNVPSGAYVAEENEETFKAGPTKGNILTRSDGIWIRNGIDKLATLQGSGLTFLVPTGTYKGQKSVSLSGAGLTFYNIGSSNSAAATLASDGLQITNGSIVLGTTDGTAAGNVTLSNKNFQRSINNVSHNDLRLAIGSKFGVSADGTLYASSAIIKGILTAGANSKIGPWNVTDTSIWYGNANFDNANGIYLGTNGLSLGSTFKVTSGGVLTATNADISGKITVGSGSNVYTTDDVNPLEIGGTNLVPHSDNLKDFSIESSSYVTRVIGDKYTDITRKTASGTTGYGIYYDIEVEASTDYTISATFSGISDEMYWSIGYKEGSETGKNQWSGVASAQLITTGGRNVRTFNTGTATKVRLCVGLRNKNGVEWTTRVSYIQLEKGNKATDWSPSPEDVTEAINTAQTTANAANNKVVTFRGTCSSGWTDGNKVVSCTGFPTTIPTGAKIDVYCSSSNNASTLTLNVNGSGAKTVKVDGVATGSTNQLLWFKGVTISFTYDGSSWLAERPTSFIGGTCSTAAATGDKVTLIETPVVQKGTQITVPMTNYNTAGTPKLKLQNSAGTTVANALYFGSGTTVPTQANGFSWPAGANVIFTFDGQYWKFGNQTFIDGGNILTGTISADRIKTNVVSAINLTSNKIDAKNINAAQITVGSLKDGSSYSTTTQMTSAINTAVEGIQIGGINLYGHGSDFQTSLDGLTNNGSYFSIVTEDGVKCAHAAGALTTTKSLVSRIPYVPKNGEKFTFSGFIKIKNIVRGTTNPMCEFYFGGVTIDGSWRGFSAEKIYIDGVDIGSFSSISFDKNITDTKWHHFALVSHFNYSGTSTVPLIYPALYLRDCTGDLYAHHVKMERGNRATDWSPAPEDGEVEYIVGTHGTTATNVWTGVTKEYSIYKGKTIQFYMTSAGTSTAATLNLTYPNGSTTGAKNIQWNNTNITTHYPQNSIITLVYDGTYWKTSAYNSDTYNRTRFQNVIKAATAITASRIICGTSSGYKNIGASVAFDISYPLLYAGSAIDAAATGDNNYLSINSINASNNGTITGGAANKTLYLKGALSGSTVTIASSGFLTATVPSSRDGFVYLPLGVMYSATNIYFTSPTRMYAYKGGKFQEVGLGYSAAHITEINDNGIKIHADNNKTTNYVQIDTEGMKVYKGGIPIAQYGTSAIIGSESAAHSVIDADGQRFYASDGSTLLANIGYGEGAPASGTTPVTAPYYTFGIRASNTSSTRGNYSVAEGVNTTASGYASHAEGGYTTAGGMHAHTEGFQTTTNGVTAHAEGNWSKANGHASHAEGYYTTASGDYSHTEGYKTFARSDCAHSNGYEVRADGKYSSVCGKYNSEDASCFTRTTDTSVQTNKIYYYKYANNRYEVVANPINTELWMYYELTGDGEYAFIIGNGTSTVDRSNALTVDWDGYIWTAKDVKTSTIVNIITANSTNATIASANYVRRGNIAQITISWTNKSAISVGESGNITNIQVGTLVSGKRPLITTGAWSVGDGAGAAWYNISTGGAINLGACEARKAAYTIAAGSTFWICSTFLVD